MTKREVLDLKEGQWVCRIDNDYTDDYMGAAVVGEPKRVTEVVSRGQCISEDKKHSRKKYVIFYHESYLVEKCNETGSCYEEEKLFIIPTESQRKRWRKNITYEEFIRD